MRDASRRNLRILGLLLVGVCWTGVFIAVWNVPGNNQWDLKTYGYASRALALGLNPYVKADLVRAVGPGSHPLPYVYPLSALYVLRPVTSIGYPNSDRLWLAIKVVVIAGLLLLWKRAFLRGTDWLWLLVVALFAFQAATAWDIRAGNVGSIEQLLLWAGFACLAARRTVAFAAFVTAAAFFKFTLAAFLLLLLLPAVWRKRNLVLIAGSMVVLVAIIALSFREHPDYFRHFLRAASMTPGDVRYNPSVYGVAVDLARKQPATFGASPAIAWSIWIVFTLAVLFAGRRLIAHVWRSPSIPLAIMVACFCYALMMPRLMLYSYMILIVPVLALVLPAARRSAGGAYALAGLVCVDGLQMLPGDAGKLLKDCEPLLVMLVCWCFLILTGPPAWPEDASIPARR